MEAALSISRHSPVEARAKITFIKAVSHESTHTEASPFNNLKQPFWQARAFPPFCVVTLHLGAKHIFPTPTTVFLQATRPRGNGVAAASRVELASTRRAAEARDGAFRQLFAHGGRAGQ